MNDKDQTLNNHGQAATISPAQRAVMPEQTWEASDYTAADDVPADFAPALVSMAFIKAAIRRSVRFWCLTALAGLLTGAGLNLAFPPAYQASASIMIMPGPVNSAAEITDDQAIAQSRTVAALAVDRLGLHETASSFLHDYTVTVLPLTDVLVITANAPSSNAAVSEANAVAAAFFMFRAKQLEMELLLTVSSLDHEVTQTRQNIASLRQQILQLPALPASPSRQAKLGSLQDELSQATANLKTLMGDITQSQTSTAAATKSAIRETKILDAAAPIPQSRLKHLILYPAAGLVLGLFLGMGIVVVRALTSDRLRRRDDIAQALGAPVRLSVGAVRVGRQLPGKRGPAAVGETQQPDVRRVVDHLRSIVSGGPRGMAALAVVPTDDLRVAALSVASLAVTSAKQGRQVLVADLADGAPAARLLGVKVRGIHEVALGRTSLTVAVPEPGETALAGPLIFGSVSAASSDGVSEAVTAACAKADLRLVLATLNPAHGAEHLATWAADAVVLVNAGRSSWTKIHAVGQMTRVAGMRVASAVLFGADRADETLGVLDIKASGGFGEAVDRQ